MSASSVLNNQSLRLEPSAQRCGCPVSKHKTLVLRGLRGWRVKGVEVDQHGLAPWFVLEELVVVTRVRTHMRRMYVDQRSFKCNNAE